MEVTVFDSLGWDNTSLDTQKAVVAMLRMIVENTLKPEARRPF